MLIAGGRGGPPVANWMYVGWTVFAIMGPGLFGFGILVALERNQGLLTFKRALPMPPGVYLTAKIAMSMVFAAGVMAMLAAAGVLFGGVTLAPLQLVTVSAVMALGVAPACAIGLFIGASVPAQVAPAIANIVYLAMAFLGGLFFPLPPAMQALRSIWPTYHLAQLALASGGLPSQGAAWTHAAVLAGLTLVLTALAAQRLARAG